MAALLAGHPDDPNWAQVHEQAAALFEDAGKPVDAEQQSAGVIC